MRYIAIASQFNNSKCGGYSRLGTLASGVTCIAQHVPCQLQPPKNGKKDRGHLISSKTPTTTNKVWSAQKTTIPLNYYCDKPLQPPVPFTSILSSRTCCHSVKKSSSKENQKSIAMAAHKEYALICLENPLLGMSIH